MPLFWELRFIKKKNRDKIPIKWIVMRPSTSLQLIGDEFWVFVCVLFVVGLCPRCLVGCLLLCRFDFNTTMGPCY